MNEEKEDPILAAPKLVKEEPTVAVPMDTNSSELVSAHVDPSSDDKEKARLDYDQRRLSLLNNPHYGVILAFLDKFRTHIDIQDYPLHLLEENLLSDQENISRRLIDFHLTLLKRISLGKGAHRDKFVPIITKFAYRFDYDDGEYLKSNGYSQAEIGIKLRVLKNLLETQFDHNQNFKTALVEKQSFEVRSQTFGRDRSGASYWLFLDTECFIRLFRENIDDGRAWTNIASDKDQFENIVKILITDNTVRKKFPNWKLTHEPFNSLEASNEFEERYLPPSVTVKKEQPGEIKQSAAKIKVEKNVVSTTKKSPSPAPIKSEVPSDQDSSASEDKKSSRSRVVSSEDTNVNGVSQEINNNQEDKPLKKSSKKSRGRRKSTNWNKKKRRTVSNTSKKEDHIEEIPPPKTSAKGRKRQQINEEEDEVEETKKNDHTSQEKNATEPFVDDGTSHNNDDPFTGLRRSSRIRKPATNEPPPVTSSPAKSIPSTPAKKKILNGKCKASSQLNVKSSVPKSKTNGRRKRRGRSSSDDEHQPSEEEEDEYNSDDYLPDNKQVDELDNDDLLEEEEDEYVPRRSAKTVAKRRGQTAENLTEDVQSPSSACYVCSKTDRPESLLLCDDCDDAYHLECLKPILLSVPDGDWYCPLCEHKRLAENLVEKFIQLIKDHEELESKRNQCMSKRSNRLANVMLNLDKMVKRSTNKRQSNGIVYSDEENEEEEEQEAENNKSEEEEEEEDQDDDDSVYGFKDDRSSDRDKKRKRSFGSSKDRRDARQAEENEKLGVRSCRRKPQNYRFDDYDKKMKEAMIDGGETGEDIDKDLDESEDEEKKKLAKTRHGYENDDDFDVPTAKNDEEFAPDQNRSDNSDSEEEEEEDYDDESSDDGDGWKSKRRPPSKKKPKSSRRKSRRKSDDDEDDESLSDSELNNIKSVDTTKSETTNDLDLSDNGNDDRRRSARATTQRNYAKQQRDSEEDEEDLYENGRPPPRRMRYKKRRGSDDSFVDDDDYDKLARKRKIVKYGKSVSRSSINDHLKKLVDDEEEPTEDQTAASPSKSEGQEGTDDATKPTNKTSTAEDNELQPSDDDDFPDEQEIFKSNGLLKLQKNLNGPKPVAPLRPAFAAPTHSYQHAIVDPTARFTMIRPPVRPAINNGCPSNGHDSSQQPSDFHQVNGHNSPPL